MAVGERVEEQLHVGHRATAVVIGEHLTQIADPHVVGDRCEILPPPKALLREAQVADCRGESLGG